MSYCHVMCHAIGVTAIPCTGTPACSASTWGRRRARCSGSRWELGHGDMVMMRWGCDDVTADRTDADQQAGLQLQPRGRDRHLHRAQQHPHIVNNYNYNYNNNYHDNYNYNYYYNHYYNNNYFYSAGLCWCLRKQDFIVREVGGVSDENIPHLFFGPCLHDNGVKNMYFWVRFWRVYIFYVTKLWIMNNKHLSKYKISTASDDCNTVESPYCAAIMIWYRSRSVGSADPSTLLLSSPHHNYRVSHNCVYTLVLVVFSASCDHTKDYFTTIQ